MAEAKLRSLFSIEEEYIKLVAELEDSLGELTPELEERLKINKEELETKVKAYYHIMSLIESDMIAITNEKARLDNIFGVKENTFNRLKNTLLEATKLFGYDGKSGNKKLDFDTLKLYTRRSESIEIDFLNFHDERAILFRIKNEFTKDDLEIIIKALSEEKEKDYGLTTEPHIVKSIVKDLINSGETLNGAKIIKKDTVIIK